MEAKAFIIHSSEDKEAFKPLLQFLKRNNITPLISEKIEGGKDWLEEIERMIRNADCSILLLTEKSLESKWVHFEVGLTRGDMKQVIPYILTTLQKTEIPEFIKKFQIIGLQKKTEKEKRKELLDAINATIFKRVFNSSFILSVKNGDTEDLSQSITEVKRSNEKYRNLDLSKSKSPKIVLENIDALRVDVSSAKIGEVTIKNSRIMALDMSASEIQTIKLSGSIIGVLDLSEANGPYGGKIRFEPKDTQVIYVDKYRAAIEDKELKS
jgi:CRISPR/Cas system-associated endoribonuclease Cas2